MTGKYSRKMPTTYFTTRPALVSYLMSLGYVPTIVPNPFEPDKRAWTFPNSTKLRKLADEFIKERREANDRTY